MIDINTKGIVKNFFSLTFSNIIGQAITFLTTIYIARKFGPTEFGIINFANVFVSYFILISTVGLPNLGIINITKDESKLSYYVNKILSLRGLLSVFAMGLLLLVVPFLDKSGDVKTMILINGITILSTGFFIDWVFQALQKMSYVAYANLLRNVIYGIVLVGSIASGIYTKIYIVPISLAISGVIGTIYLLLIYRYKEKQKIKFDLTIKDSKIMVVAAVPFFFSGIFAAFNNNIDILMLGFLKSSYEVGLYSAVYKFINIITVFISFLFTPLYPYLIKYYHEKNWSVLNTLVNKLTKFVYLLAIPMLVGALALRDDVILTVYGSKFLTSDVQFIFVVLMIHVTILFIREIYGYELTAWGFQTTYMKIIMCSSLFNILANFIFIPFFGLRAAALATLISEIINVIFMRRVSKKAVDIKLEKKYFIGIFFSSFVMGLTVYLLRSFVFQNIFGLVTIGMIVYGILILLTKVLTKDELKYLKRGG
ncbi:flippase [Carnobacterium maltaromaticum]|uniref:flippase n=1 Tax=Carnobacterium maltaromaticum TaxID=2751 RepID=UPI0039BE7DFD